MQPNRAKEKETILTLCTALVVIFLVVKKHPIQLLYASVALGVIGMFFEWLTAKIHWAWMKLAEAMGWVMNKVILAIIFYGFLFPLAMLSRLFGNNSMQLKRKSDTYYHTRNHTYVKKDLEGL
jgi:hypothetical protein